MAMTEITMYPAQKDSPSTTILENVSTTDTKIAVGSVGILPQEVPYPLTLGYEENVTEVVLVTAIDHDANILTIERGSAPMAWESGTLCARMFNSSDLDAVQENLHNVIDLANNAMPLRYSVAYTSIVPTIPWYKMASISESLAYFRDEAIFRVYKSNSTQQIGSGVLHIFGANTAINPTIAWEYMYGLKLGDFILAYERINGILTMELYGKLSAQNEKLIVEDLSSADNSTRVVGTWTMYPTATAVAAIPSNFTQVVSTRADIGMTPLNFSVLNNSTSSASWYEFASFTGTTGVTLESTYYVKDRYAVNSSPLLGEGILSAHVGTNGTNSNNLFDLKWLTLTESANFTKDDFVMLYSVDATSVTVKLFARIRQQYDNWYVQELVSRQNVTTKFTMASPVGVAALPAGYTQVVSTRADIGMVPLQYNFNNQTLNTEQWFEVGNATLTLLNTDACITLEMDTGYYPENRIAPLGCVNLQAQAGNGTSVPHSALATWSTLSGDLQLSDFTVLISETTALPVTFRFFVRIPASRLYGQVWFYSRNSHTRNVNGPSWTINERPTGLATLPTGYTQVISTRADIGMVPKKWAIVQHNTQDMTNSWYMVGRLTMGGIWIRHSMILHVSNGMADQLPFRSGILNVIAWTEEAVTKLGLRLVWEYNAGFPLENFELRGNNTNPNDVELWTRAEGIYNRWTFTVLWEGYQDGDSQAFTLYNNPTGQAEPSNWPNKAVSTLAQTQHPTFTNEQLLKNAWFQLWTAGDTPYNTNNGSFANNWFLQSSALIVTRMSSGGIEIAATGAGAIGNLIPWNIMDNYLGKQTALSVLYADGAIDAGTVSVPAVRGAMNVGIALTKTPGRLQLYAPNATTSPFFQVYLTGTDTRQIRAVKLELGVQSTLKNDVSPDYNSEYLHTTGLIPTQTNKNLIIDPTFSLRSYGNGPFTVTQGYFTPNWYVGSANSATGSVTLNSNGGVSVANAASSLSSVIFVREYMNDTMRQYLSGKRVTISILVSANTGTGNGQGNTFNFRIIKATESWVETSLATTELKPGQVGVFSATATLPTLLPTDRLYPQFNVNASSQVTIEAYKLEVGESETLSNDSPPDYNSEYLRAIGQTPTQSNVDLFDNGGLVVNQKGESSYSSADALAITFDRWEIRYVDLTISANSVRIASNATTSVWTEFTQRFEESDRLALLGKTVTISVKTVLDGIQSFTYTMPTDSNAAINISSLPFPSSRYRIGFYRGTGERLRARIISERAGANGDFVDLDTSSGRVFKLEIGSVSTLANDGPVDYGMELAKCQRYQLVMTAWTYIRASTISTNVLRFFIPTPVTFNGPPTFAGTPFQVVNTGGVTYDGFTTTSISNTGNGLDVLITKSNHGLADASIVLPSGLILDANL